MLYILSSKSTMHPSSTLSIPFKYLPHAGARKLEKLSGAREDDQAYFRIAQHGQLVSFLQQPVPTFGEGDLSTGGVLDPLDLDFPTANGDTSLELLTIGVSVISAVERHVRGDGSVVETGTGLEDFTEVRHGGNGEGFTGEMARKGWC